MTVKELTSVALIVLGSFSACALNELGPLAEARKRHPAVFIPGNVLAYEVAGQRGYVFNGEAERDFGDEEGDAELLRMAELDAKRNLLRHLKKREKNPNLTVSLRRCTALYVYSEGNALRGVYFVARENVVKRTVEEAPATNAAAVRPLMLLPPASLPSAGLPAVLPAVLPPRAPSCK